jgi:hypothetical protein
MACIVELTLEGIQEGINLLPASTPSATAIRHPNRFAGAVSNARTGLRRLRAASRWRWRHSRQPAGAQSNVSVQRHH